MTNHAEAPRFIERFIEQVEEGEYNELTALKNACNAMIENHSYQVEVRMEFSIDGLFFHGFHFWQGARKGLVKDYEAEMQDTKKLDYRITRC